MTFFAVAALERLADDNLAFAAVVGVRRVDVADAVVDGVANHANRFGFVNFAVGVVGKRMQPKPSMGFPG